MSPLSPSVNIIIPAYNKEINFFERKSLRQCVKVLGHYPLTLIAPQSLDTGNYTRIYPFKIERFSDDNFTSLNAYSRLLLSADFYRRFSRYSYILMYQPDSYVFRDELERWCSQGYDYIGAPVPERPLTDIYKYNLLNPDEKGRVFFGNGGFSLRKVSAFIDLLSSAEAKIEPFLKFNINEDLINCILLYRSGKNLPDKDTAMRFSIDAYPAQAFRASNNKLPFGCHGWYRNDSEYYDAYFWLPKIFPVTGYLCRSFIYRFLLRS